MTPLDLKPLARVLEQCRSLQAPLSVRLEQFAAGLAEHAPAYHRHYATMIARLQTVRAGAGAPRVAEKFPGFTLPDAAGRLHTLDDLLAAGPLVVSFNRGHWCQFCQIELAALAEAQSDLARFGASAVAILPETSAWLGELTESTGASFPLLSDAGLSFSTSIGLTIPVDPVLIGMLAADGDDLAAYHNGHGSLLPIPATFLLDRAGNVVLAHVDPDFRQRLDISEILNVLGRRRP